ncbi:MAG: hypothetical protein ACF8LK_05955 [Phycisphaerales bacterium JB041]
MQHHNADDSHIPEDIRAVAGRLDRLGAQDRSDGEDASFRVAMRTKNLLRAEAAPGARPHGRLRAAWLWLAAPVTAAAAVLVAVVISMPPAGPTPGPSGNGVEVLAAGLENDIETFLAIDGVWNDDSFETGLTLISLDAAGLANQTTPEEALEALGSDL